MIGDGNGWNDGPEGQKVWGKYGAAGLLLVAEGKYVLLQHRAEWTNQGGTWALPGGARDSHETAAEAAVREAIEETEIDPSAVAVEGEKVTAGPGPTGWTYTTVLARCEKRLSTTANAESLELRWVPLGDVDKLPLLPAFGASWPDLLLWAS